MKNIFYQAYSFRKVYVPFQSQRKLHLLCKKIVLTKSCLVICDILVSGNYQSFAAWIFRHKYQDENFCGEAALPGLKFYVIINKSWLCLCSHQESAVSCPKQEILLSGTSHHRCIFHKYSWDNRKCSSWWQKCPKIWVYTVQFWALTLNRWQAEIFLNSTNY